MKQTLPPPRPLPGFSPHHMFMHTPLRSLSSKSKTSRCTANRSGFTLIELLVVISIIAILTVIGIVSYATVQKNVRDARRKIDINYIGQAIEATYNPGGNSYSFSGETNLPKDPINSGQNQYWYKDTVAADPELVGTNRATTTVLPAVPAAAVITGKYFICAFLEGSGGGNYKCTYASGTTTFNTTGGSDPSCYCQVSKQKQ